MALYAGRVTRNRNQNPGLPPKGSGGITRKGRIGEIAAWGIAGIAWCISYGTQVALAVEHGFHGPEDWEAAGMGATSDLLSLACMMIALDQAERGKSTPLAWVLSVAAAVMMEWANIVYAGSDFVAIILHAWPPAVAVSVVFLLVHVRRVNAMDRDPEPTPEVEPPAPPPAPFPRPPLMDLSIGQEPAVGAEPEPNGQQKVTLARAQREYRKLAAKGAVTGSALGRALGVSDVSGRNWKRKVEAEAKPARPFRVAVSGQEAA